MYHTVISSKGQMVFPKDLRDSYGLHAGTEMVIEEAPGGFFIRPLQHQTASIDDVAGCLAYKGKPVSIKEMDEAVLSAVADDFVKSTSR